MSIDIELGAETPHLLKILNSPSVCGCCGKTLKYEREFNQAVNVCEKCLGTYCAVDAILNESAERKAIDAPRRRFLEGLK